MRSAASHDKFFKTAENAVSNSDSSWEEGADGGPINLSSIKAVTTNTLFQRVFSSVHVLVDVNQQLPWFFTSWPREDFFPVSQAPERICRRLSRFCNILLQYLTPLYVKITRSTNLLSVCRKKLKLSTY